MTIRFVDLLSKEVDFDDSMPLKQAHYVLNRLIEEVDFDNVIEAGSLSRTGRQHHCDGLHLNLVQVLVLSLF